MRSQNLTFVLQARPYYGFESQKGSGEWGRTSVSRRRNLCQDILYVIDWNVVSMHVRGYGRSSSLVESCTRGSQAEKLKDDHWKKAMVAFASGKDVLVSLPTAHCKRLAPAPRTLIALHCSTEVRQPFLALKAVEGSGL